jgi:hypothetical protein
MGQAKQRKEKFLNQPCIFCGGTNLSTTVDHIPARSFFLNRQWPEGFEFPACLKCNQESRSTEARLALISRLDPTLPENSPIHAEAEKMIEGIRRNDSEFLRELSAPVDSESQKNILKEYGIPYDDGDEIETNSVIGIPPSLSLEVQNYGFKLAKATHWKHTNKIVPQNADMLCYWQTNANMRSHRIDKIITEFLLGIGATERNKKSLNDQFAYRWGTSPDGHLGAYYFLFRFTFSIVVFLSFVPNGLQKAREHINSVSTQM